jgi:lysophospholipase L1-like esterase
LIAAAARRHDCPLLDMGAHMRAAVDDSVAVEPEDFRDLTTWQGKPGYRTCDLVGPDGVHLNHGGEIVYGRAIFERLMELGWLPK